MTCTYAGEDELWRDQADKGFKGYLWLPDIRNQPQLGKLHPQSRGIVDAGAAFRHASNRNLVGRLIISDCSGTRSEASVICSECRHP